MTLRTRPALGPGRRLRLALSALVVPFALGASACESGLTEKPVVTTTTDPQVIVMEGRPLRRRNGRVHRARSRRGHSRLTDRQALWLAPAAREALGNHWRNQAELEHASVIAFEDLARRLALVDAPDDLLRRSLRAAQQEADHAERCWLAEQQLLRARDHRVQDTLAVIAHDEAEHARLSADVLLWCVSEGGAAVSDAVAATAAELPQRMFAPLVPAGIDRGPLGDHGLFDSDPEGDGYRHVLAATLALVSLEQRSIAA
jgi:hypothetical protein